MSKTIPRVSPFASRTPSAPPATDSTTLSVSNWRSTRARPAPTDMRSAISRRLAVARAICKIGHISASDQQQKADGPGEQPQAGLHLARRHRDVHIVAQDGGESLLRVSPRAGFGEFRVERVELLLGRFGDTPAASRAMGNMGRSLRGSSAHGEPAAVAGPPSEA